jgi:hypothetical protein
MIDYVKSFEFTSAIALFVYWIPLAICLAVYFITAVNMYREDVKKRDEGDWYSPKLTIGWIVWHVLASIAPAANLIALVFDCMADVFKWFGDFLDIPLVPKRAKRAAKEAA